jgi:hypothetical protein
MKVEHLVFSAFVLKQLDPTGKPAADTTDSKLQPLLIMNGSFLER